MKEALKVTKRTNATRAWRLLAALALALSLWAFSAQEADAEPRLKVHCEVYDTNRVDPIAFSQHLHHQIGNTSTSNSSTGESLFNHKETSCDMPWFRSGGWFPVERGEEDIRGVNVYYRAPGDQTKIRAMPTGLQLLGTQEKYNCGRGSTFTQYPQYACKGTWATQVSFPDCIDTSKLADEATNAVNSRKGVCPSSHPYRIPKISFLISHYNRNGVVANPLMVSAGVDDWHDHTFMHADYFAANQSVFNDELLDLCLRNAPDSVTTADPRCG